jgi:hypothetical protein
VVSGPPPRHTTGTVKAFAKAAEALRNDHIVICVLGAETLRQGTEVG